MRANHVMRACGLLAVLGALAVGACGGNDSDSGSGSSAGGDGGAPVEIKIGQIPTGGLVVLQSMLTPPAGLKLQNGTAYKLTQQSFSGTPDVLQGLATGSLDAGSVGATALFPALDKGVKLLITGEFFDERSGWLSNGFYVKKGSGVDSPDDMRGKVMAVNQVGAPVYWLGVSYMKKANLAPNDDYKVATVPFPNMLAALDAKQVNAAPLILPFLNQAEAAPDKYQRLFLDTDVQDPYVQSLMVFRKDFVDDHRDAVRAFMADWAKAATFVRDPANHEAVVNVVSQATKVPAKNLDYVATRKFYYIPPAGRPDLKAIQSNWDWFRGIGGTKKSYNVNDYVDPELLPK